MPLYSQHTSTRPRDHRVPHRRLTVWLVELTACLTLLLGTSRPAHATQVRYDSLAVHQVTQPTHVAADSASRPSLTHRIVRFGTVVAGTVAGAAVGWRVEWVRYTPRCPDCGGSSNARNNATTLGAIVGAALGGGLGWLLGSHL